MEVICSRPVSVRELCGTLERLCSCRGVGRKKLLLRLFEAARSCGDLYGVVRLLLPKQDLERCNYNMKEQALGMCLVNALGLSSTSPDAKLLSNWKQTGCSVAGDFSLVAAKVLVTRQQNSQANFSVHALNEFLDLFASASHREAKANVLRDIIKMTTVKEMKWVLRMILKDLRCGIGENFILEVLHPDARPMMQFCMDLKNVCEHLHDHSSRFKHQDVVVGKALKSQLSKRMDSIDIVWDLMRSKSIVAELKFDGDRMQVHKDGNNISFWSRNGKEHKEYLIPLQDILRQQLLSERCVFDGELLVWDCLEQRFKQRTSSLLSSTARSVRKGWESDDQLCYVVFDILFEEKHGSVIHLSLRDRRQLIRAIVQPLVPQLQSTVHGDMKWATYPATKQQLNDFFNERVEGGDEGIIVKDLESKWSPGNRDGRWCKIKPDYVSMGADHDLVIIGGYYGSGSRGGNVVSYLLALIDTSENHRPSPRFITLCRCGVGLSEEEHTLLRNKISPLFLSVILQITSEQRVFRTTTFRAQWTFRFPRVVRVRYDKGWSDALSIQEFEGMVARAKTKGYSLLNGFQKCNSFFKSSGAKKHKKSTHERSSRVLPHLQMCNVSGVPQLSCHMNGLLIFICNTETELERESLQKHIKQCGGEIVMNLLSNVTYIVAAKEKGVHFKVAVREDRDVLKISWLKECIDQRKMLPIQSRDYVFQSSTTTKKMQENLDCFGDTWFENIERDDLYKIVEKMPEDQLPKLTINACKWLDGNLKNSSIFRGCVLYFHQLDYMRHQELSGVAWATLKRLAFESTMVGASVVEGLTNVVTHVIIYAPFEIEASSKTIATSLTEYEQALLQNQLVDVLSHRWLEDCLQGVKQVNVAPYSLRRADAAPHQISQNVHDSASLNEVLEPNNIPVNKHGIPSTAEHSDDISKVITKLIAKDASPISLSRKDKRVASSDFMLIRSKKCRLCKIEKAPVEQLELPTTCTAKGLNEISEDHDFLKGQSAANGRRIYGGKNHISSTKQALYDPSLCDSSSRFSMHIGRVGSLSTVFHSKGVQKLDMETINCRSDAIKDTIEEHVGIWVSGIQSLSESFLS